MTILLTLLLLWTIFILSSSGGGNSIERGTQREHVRRMEQCVPVHGGRCGFVGESRGQREAQKKLSLVTVPVGPKHWGLAGTTQGLDPKRVTVCVVSSNEDIAMSQCQTNTLFSSNSKLMKHLFQQFFCCLVYRDTDSLFQIENVKEWAGKTILFGFLMKTIVSFSFFYYFFFVSFLSLC